MNLPQTPDDWTKLAAAAQAADPEAVENLAVAIGLLARKIFRCASLSVEDAEDLAQECVWHIFQCLNQFHGQKFSAWVTAILKNRLIDHFRRSRRRPPTIPSVDNDQDLFEVACASNLGSNGWLDNEGHAALEEALSQFPANVRRLIESQAGFQKASFRQMALELDISETSARVKYHRAKQKLRSLLENDARLKDWLLRHSAA